MVSDHVTALCNTIWLYLCRLPGFSDAITNNHVKCEDGDEKEGWWCQLKITHTMSEPYFFLSKMTSYVLYKLFIPLFLLLSFKRLSYRNDTFPLGKFGTTASGTRALLALCVIWHTPEGLVFSIWRSLTRLSLHSRGSFNLLPGLLFTIGFTRILWSCSVVFSCACYE